ncbi:MAG: hypothetical protein AB7E72_17910 [Lysobacterales bacterium]
MKRALAAIFLILLAVGLWRASATAPTAVEAPAVSSESRADGEQEQAVTTPVPAASKPSTASVLSPTLRAEIHDAQSARAAMSALQDHQDCWLARNQRWLRRWESQTRSAWLPPSEREQARARLPQARQRLLAACRRAGLSEEDPVQSLQPRNWDEILSLAEPMSAEITRIQGQALRAGDLQARMHELADRRDRAQVDGEMRALLESALTQAIRDGQWELLPELALVLARHAGPELGPLASWYGIDQNSHAANIDVDQRALWLLVACDLGLECGAGSITLDRLCLREGLCAYPDVASAVYDGIVRRRSAQETELRRQWAVNRIRRGQINGMFDPAPERARSGGG